MKTELRPGDYFCVRTGSWVAGAILAAQKLKALDRESTYNHAGIVVASDGTTFESLRRIAHYDINAYTGCRILVARHRDMTMPAFMRGYHAVKKWDGRVYPFWRLALHAVGLAKFLHVAEIPVCSELVVEHCHHAGLCDYRGYGWNPDNLADKFRNYKCYDVLYEGEW
ncbi:MAG TPA: hypothetical protein PKH25_00950 [Syntrophales bacterium]|nr:hypothetical protein [Syntrophales bacterium]